MQTFRQIQACEGYYYDTRTGDILRSVGPGSVHCWRDDSWSAAEPRQEWDEPRFELLTQDIALPFREVQQLAEARFPGRVSGTIVNRQTARQPDDSLITEEAVSHLPPHASRADESHAAPERQPDAQAMVNDVICGMALHPDEAVATSEHQGLTYYFCAPRCKEQFDRDPERYASKWIKEIRRLPS